MCEIYSRWSGGRRFGHFIIFCHPCPDWQQAAVRVGNLTLNIVCLTRGIGFRNLIQNRLNKLGKYWLLEISQNKKSCVDTTNYIRLEGWFVVDVGAGDGPLSRRGWGWGWVFSLIGDQSAVFCKPFTDLSTVSTRTGDSAPLLSWRHLYTVSTRTGDSAPLLSWRQCVQCLLAPATLIPCYHDTTCPACPLHSHWRLCFLAILPSSSFSHLLFNVYLTFVENSGTV